MARLLWVADEPPNRQLGGGNIREANLLLHLADANDVTLLVSRGPVDPALAGIVRVVEAGADDRSRVPSHNAAAVLASFTRRGPSEVLSAEAPRRALAARLDELARDHDAVLLTNLQLAPLLRARPSAAAARWIANMHHVPSVQYAQRAAVAERARLRVRLAGEARRARYWEQFASRTADAVVAVSDDDAAHLRRAGARRVIVSPNGVDLDHFTATPLPSDPTAVFIATLGYSPNADGARWLANEIWPQVVERVPAARLSIVGRSPSPVIRALGDHPTVTVHADVPDIDPHLRAARVALVPLRAGTGTRLKVLEAMAAGRPVVGTTIGLEGLGLRPGVDALVADSAIELAGAVVTIFEDDDRAREIVDAALETVRSFGWPAIGAQLGLELERLLR
jgi:glycosyltransferase involved in cell wall biosynthesis